MDQPRTPRRGEEANITAMEQLADARRRQRDLTVRAEAAEGTPDEEHAADALASARNRVAAREAWVVWTERGIT